MFFFFLFFFFGGGMLVKILNFNIGGGGGSEKNDYQVLGVSRFCAFLGSPQNWTIFYYWLLL